MATNPVVFRPFRYVERASRVMLWRMRGRWDGIERVPTRLPRADVPVAVGKGVVAVHIPKASIASVVQVAHAQPRNIQPVRPKSPNRFDARSCGGGFVNALFGRRNHTTQNCVCGSR